MTTYGYFARTLWKEGDPLPDVLPPEGTPLVGETGPVGAPADNPAAWAAPVKRKRARPRWRRLLARLWYIIFISIHGAAIITVLQEPATDMTNAQSLLLGAGGAAWLWIITFAVWYWNQGETHV